MEDRLFDHPAVPQMLGNDAFEEFRRDIGVPDALRIDGHNRPAFTYAEAGCFGSLDAIRVEEEIFALKEPGQLAVNGAAATVGRAKASGTH
jgi:hypothetical protein